MLTAVDYQRALQIQDACNLSGIVHSFSTAMGRIWDEAHEKGVGTEWVNKHPIAVLYASKIATLTGAESARGFSSAYQICQDAAEQADA